MVGDYTLECFRLCHKGVSCQEKYRGLATLNGKLIAYEFPVCQGARDILGISLRHDFFVSCFFKNCLARLVVQFDARKLLK